MRPRLRNCCYVGVYIDSYYRLNTENLADLARFIHEQFGGLTRAVYVSGCHRHSHPTAKITLARFLDGYNKMLLEGGGADDSTEMLISAEKGLILVSGGEDDSHGKYIARVRNKPASTWWWWDKKNHSNLYEPRDCAARTRVPAIASDASAGALAEFPRGQP